MSKVKSQLHDSRHVLLAFTFQVQPVHNKMILKYLNSRHIVVIFTIDLRRQTLYNLTWTILDKWGSQMTGKGGGVERLTDKLNLTSAGDVTVSAPVQWVGIPWNFILYLVPSMYSINIGCNPSSNASSLALHTIKNKWWVYKKYLW